jgi:hypothetical protein
MIDRTRRPSTRSGVPVPNISERLGLEGEGIFDQIIGSMPLPFWRGLAALGG